MRATRTKPIPGPSRPVEAVVRPRRRGEGPVATGAAQLCMPTAALAGPGCRPGFCLWAQDRCGGGCEGSSTGRPRLLQSLPHPLAPGSRNSQSAGPGMASELGVGMRKVPWVWGEHKATSRCTHCHTLWCLRDILSTKDLDLPCWASHPLCPGPGFTRSDGQGRAHVIQLVGSEIP